jgi:regulator of protease activity HflC (stomatin/prohibitin superfamily)
MEFGRVVHTQKAGLLPAWPRPIEQVRMLPGSARPLTRQVAAQQPLGGIVEASAEANAQGMAATYTPYLTGDSKVVMLDATLVYRITDPVAYVLSESHVAPALDRMFHSVATKVAAGQDLNDFLVFQNTGATEEQAVDAARARVRDRLKEGVNARLAALKAGGVSLGVEIDRIDWTAALPPKAKLAFDSVPIASQKADQAIAAANNSAELRKQGADQEADRVVSAAQAVAAERTVAATVDTTSIVAIERRNGQERKGLAEQYYRDKIGGALSKAGNVVVVDPNSGRRLMMNTPARPTAPPAK